MTPRDVDAMSDAEYRAFWRYAITQTREEQRQIRRAQRKGGHG